VVVIILAVTVMVATAAPAWAQADGLDVNTTVQYFPDPAEERIDVSATYTMTSLQADETVGDSVRSFFFTKWVIALPAAVTDFTATSDGADLVTTIEPDPDSPDVVFATIQLPFNLNFQQTVQLDVNYVLPGGEPRTAGTFARVNESFLSFPVWAAGDPNQTTVRIQIPDGFMMNLQGDLDEFREIERNDQRFLEAVALEDPRSFFGQVFGRNDEGLLTESATLPDGTATIRAWPDDPDWVDFVVEAIENDVPIIEQLTGLEWPAGDIEVIETVTPYLYGYGGWFNASSGLIEVGDQLERDLILHELGHAWFNEELIDGRWITEGLAEEYASRTIGLSSDAQPNPDEPDLANPLRVQLAEWGSPWALSEEDAYAYEQYHYNASWWVIRKITDDVGLSTFGEVLVDLKNDVIPYAGDGPIERTVETTRWTHLFDLLEMKGATNLDQLFTTYVLTEADAARLSERRDALLEYEALDRAAADWAPPLVVRRSLTAWDFEAATEAIDMARQVLAARDAADALANELDVRAERNTEPGYEAADDLAALGNALKQEQQLNADLDQLRGEREQLVKAATATNTQVEFAPVDYDDAAAALVMQQDALENVRSLRSQVEQLAGALGLTSPDPQSDDPADFAAAAALAEARLATLTAIDETVQSADQSRSLLERVGLFRNDPDEALDQATAAFELDQLDEALFATRRADSIIEQASATGRTRLLWLGAIFIGMVVMSILINRIMIRRQSARSSLPV